MSNRMMTGWCQRKCLKKKVVQFAHVFGSGCCPRACPLPACPGAQLTKIFVLCWALQRKTEGENEGSEAASASIQQSGWGSTAGYQSLCCAVYAVASFTLSHTKRKRGTESKPWACFSPLTFFPHFFLSCENTDSKKGKMNLEKQEEEQPVALRQLGLELSE